MDMLQYPLGVVSRNGKIMDILEACQSVLELGLIYSVLVLIDCRNKISLRGLIVLFILLTSILFICNIYMAPFNAILSITLCSVGFAIAIRRNVLDYIVDFILAFCICGILQQPIIFFAEIIDIENKHIQMFISAFLIALLIVIITFLIGKGILRSVFRKYYYQYRKRLMFSLLMIIVVFYLLSQMWIEKPRLYAEYQGMMIVIISVLVVSVVLLIKSIIVQNLKERQIEMILLYGDYQEKTIEKLKSNEHDMIAVFQGIYSIAERSKDIENKEDILNFLDRNNKAKINISKIGSNTQMSALLYEKSRFAELLNIDFEYNLKNIHTYNIPENDLERILINLIDNAIEYTAQHHSTLMKKKISIEFSDIAIKIIQPLSADFDLNTIDKFMEKGYSTKTGIDRGYGLVSVKNLIEKNDLLFEFDVAENKNCLIATIVFYK